MNTIVRDDETLMDDIRKVGKMLGWSVRLLDSYGYFTFTNGAQTLRLRINDSAFNLELVVPYYDKVFRLREESLTLILVLKKVFIDHGRN